MTAVNAAYIWVGHKGSFLCAHRLTTVAEGNTLSDEQLLALGESRVDEEIAKLRAETPAAGVEPLNVFKTAVKVGFVSIGNRP